MMSFDDERLFRAKLRALAGPLHSVTASSASAASAEYLAGPFPAALRSAAPRRLRFSMAHRMF